MDTFCKHIVSRCRAASKMDSLCGQIGESSLLCRGVYVDLLYEHNAVRIHSANTLSLDVGLLQKQTHYVDKLIKVPTFVEVYIWTYCTNTLQHRHILQTNILLPFIIVNVLCFFTILYYDLNMHMYLYNFVYIYYITSST